MRSSTTSKRRSSAYRRAWCTERVHIARVGGWPYHVVYVVTGDLYRVIAVTHEKREPGYWLRRLR